MSTREFTFGLRTLLRASRPQYSTRTRLWPLCVAWTALAFAWWRGVYYPIADRLNIIFWYYGWFGRWKARPGDVITVHGTPAPATSSPSTAPPPSSAPSTTAPSPSPPATARNTTGRTAVPPGGAP